jgi:hypothetical protein
MRRFLRKQFSYFMIGFVIAFVIYLFVRYNVDAILLGLIIGIAGGVASAFGITWLERRFPDDAQAAPQAAKK